MDEPVLRREQVLDQREEPAGDAQSRVLLEDDHIQVTRVVIREGEQHPTYKASGPVTMHCAEGRVVVQTTAALHELAAGADLHLRANEPHTVRALEGSVLLIVNFASREPRQEVLAQPPGEQAEEDVVQEASEESFPASDAPSWTPLTSP